MTKESLSDDFKNEVESESIGAYGVSNHSISKQKKAKRRSVRLREQRKKSMKSITSSIKNQLGKMKGSGKKYQISKDSGVSRIEDNNLSRAAKPRQTKPPKMKAQTKVKISDENLSVETSNIKGVSNLLEPEMKQKESTNSVKSIDRNVQLTMPKTQKSKKTENRNRSKTLKDDPGLSGIEMRDIVMENELEKQNRFQSFTDTSDYSDMDFDGNHLDSDASSTFSSRNFQRSFHRSESVSTLQSRDSSEFSGSYSTLEIETDGLLERQQQSAINRNPVIKREWGRNPRHHVEHEEHISSPRRSRKNSNRFIDDVYDDLSSSDDSSFVSGTSYYSSESGSDYAFTSGISGRSNSESDSESDCDSDSDSASDRSSSSESDANDDHHTMSYDRDDRYRDMTFDDSEYWTDRRGSSFGSEETERTDLTSKRNQEPMFLLTMQAEEEYDESRSNVHYSRDMGNANRIPCSNVGSFGSMDRDEFEAFVKEQEGTSGRTDKQQVDLQSTSLEAQSALKNVSGNMVSLIFGESVVSGEKSQPSDHVVQQLESFESRDRSVGVEYLEDIEDEKLKFTALSERFVSSREDAVREEMLKARVSSDDDAASTKFGLDQSTDIVADEISHESQAITAQFNSTRSIREVRKIEVPLSDLRSESQQDEETSGRQLSVTMRGSGTYDDMNDDIESVHENQETKTVLGSSRLPIGSDPSPVDVIPAKNTPTNENIEDDASSYFCCCFSPNQSADEAEGTEVEDGGASTKSHLCFSENQHKVTELIEAEDNPLADGVENKMEDDETYASTINTEGTQDFLSRNEAGGDDVESLKVGGEEKFLGSTRLTVEKDVNTGSRHGISQSNASEDDIGHDSLKRIKAECMDNYDISEVLRGKKSFKSKKSEDGCSISQSLSPSERLERRKHTLRARNESLRQSLSKDHGRSSEEIDVDGIDKKKLEENNDGSRPTDSVEVITIPSNSLVPDDISVPALVETPDDFFQLIRNAITAMMSPDPPTIVSSTVDKTEQINIDDSDGDEQVEGKASTSVKDETKVPGKSPSMENISSQLLNTQNEIVEQLKCTDYNPNAVGRLVGKTRSSEEATNERDLECPDQLYSSDSFSSSPSDEAVLKTTGSRCPEEKATENTDLRRFNIEGIPLELKPKKIWRVFDSGFQDARRTKDDKSEETEIKIPHMTNENVEKVDLASSLNETRPEEDQAETCDQKELQPSSDFILVGVKNESKSVDPEQNSSKLHSSKYRQRTDLKRLRNVRSTRKKTLGGHSLKDNENTIEPNEDETKNLKPPKSPQEKQNVSPIKRRVIANQPRKSQTTQRSSTPEKGEIPLKPSSTSRSGTTNQKDIPLTFDRSKSPHKKESVSEIRSRIKQRRKSKLKSQMQQQWEGNKIRVQSSPTAVPKKSNPMDKQKGVSIRMKVTASTPNPIATDRRDDHDSSKHEDEFFDAKGLDDDAPMRQFSDSLDRALSLD